MTKIPVTTPLKSVSSILENILNSSAVQFNVKLGALASLVTRKCQGDKESKFNNFYRCRYVNIIIVLPFLDLDLVNKFITENVNGKSTYFGNKNILNVTCRLNLTRIVNIFACTFFI